MSKELIQEAELMLGYRSLNYDRGDFMDLSQRLLAALKEREWLPISEAKKGGLFRFEEKLLTDGSHLWLGHESCFGGDGSVKEHGDFTKDLGGVLHGYPTHWMPLPPAPEEKI